MENAVNPTGNVDAGQPTPAVPTGTTENLTPAQEKAIKQMFKVTVDGQELEVDEDEMRRGYSHAKKAATALQEAARIRKEAEAVARLFKEDPLAVFQHLGLDPNQFAEKIINDRLQEAMMDPKDRELQKYKTDLQRYQEQERIAREQHEQEQAALAQEQLANTLVEDLQVAIQKAGLPQSNPYIVNKVFTYLRAANQKGWHDAKPSDVIGLVKKEIEDEIRAFHTSMPEDQIETFLGADFVKKAAKLSLKKPLEQIADKSVNQNKRDTNKKPAESTQDYFARLRKERLARGR